MHSLWTPLVVVRKQELPLSPSDGALAEARSAGALLQACDCTAPAPAMESFDPSGLRLTPAPGPAPDAPFLVMGSPDGDDAFADGADQPSSAPVPVVARTRGMP